MGGAGSSNQVHGEEVEWPGLPPKAGGSQRDLTAALHFDGEMGLGTRAVVPPVNMLFSTGDRSQFLQPVLPHIDPQPDTEAAPTRAPHICKTCGHAKEYGGYKQYHEGRWSTVCRVPREQHRPNHDCNVKEVHDITSCQGRHLGRGAWCYCSECHDALVVACGPPRPH